MRLLGVAYPAGACGCEDWLLRGGVWAAGHGDLVCRCSQTRLPHGVRVDDPREVAALVAACPETRRPAQQLRNHVPCLGLGHVEDGRQTRARLRGDACHEQLALVTMPIHSPSAVRVSSAKTVRASVCLPWRAQRAVCVERAENLRMRLEADQDRLRTGDASRACEAVCQRYRRRRRWLRRGGLVFGGDFVRI